LVVNNLRDIDTDAKAGKRTLAVRIGPAGTKVEYVALLTVAVVTPAVGVTVLGWPVAALAALLVLPLCWSPLRTVLRYGHPRELIPALGATARVTAVYGLLLTLGLGLG
jgi:1,4-dihydroxy-2-naphthoate octaprenyltransferase